MFFFPWSMSEYKIFLSFDILLPFFVLECCLASSLCNKLIQCVTCRVMELTLFSHFFWPFEEYSTYTVYSILVMLLLVQLYNCICICFKFTWSSVNKEFICKSLCSKYIKDQFLQCCLEIHLSFSD